MARQRRLIDTVTTDANGVATLNYTGTGAGLLQIEAEVVVGSGQVYTSETFELGDWLFYDGGVSGDNYDNWSWNSEKITRTVSDTGTTLEIANATISTYYLLSQDSISGDWEATVRVENQSSISVRFGFLSGSTRQYILYTPTGSYYLKLVRENGVTTGYYSTNGENWTQKSLSGTEPSSDTVYLYIGQYNTSSTSCSMTFRDLKVKSI